jgi:hypothetical protein
MKETRLGVSQGIHCAIIFVVPLLIRDIFGHGDETKLEASQWRVSALTSSASHMQGTPFGVRAGQVS